MIWYIARDIIYLKNRGVTDDKGKFSISSIIIKDVLRKFPSLSISRLVDDRILLAFDFYLLLLLLFFLFSDQSIESLTTVKPVHSGHLWFQKTFPLCTGVCYIEVFLYESNAIPLQVHSAPLQLSQVNFKKQRIFSVHVSKLNVFA